MQRVLTNPQVQMCFKHNSLMAQCESPQSWLNAFFLISAIPPLGPMGGLLLSPLFQELEF